MLRAAAHGRPGSTNSAWIFAECHPFFTGGLRASADIEGQVDNFYKKLSVRQNYVEQQKVKKS
ncbi:MAG: 50S ribosomal protein L31 [Anaerolineales bacterium]